jgi:hypothetical protein
MTRFLTVASCTKTIRIIRQFSQKQTCSGLLAGTFYQLIGDRLFKTSTTLFNSSPLTWIPTHGFQTPLKLLQSVMCRVASVKNISQCWEQNCENFYQEYNFNHNNITANRLLEELNKQRKRKWEHKQ